MHHYRKTRKLYNTRLRKNSCPFCDPATIKNQIKVTKHSYIVPNLTQYDMWEMLDVVGHLLVVPKRHVLSLKELTDEEKLDHMNIIAAYEAEGYNIYARSVDSSTRSVPHQHTHLIKASGKRAKAVLFLQKPYFLFKF